MAQCEKMKAIQESMDTKGIEESKMNAILGRLRRKKARFQDIEKQKAWKE